MDGYEADEAMASFRVVMTTTASKVSQKRLEPKGATDASHLTPHSL